MTDNDLITRREVELVLLEKGQKSRRYKLGEIWELNFDEIREALSEYHPKIVRCKDCKYCGSEIRYGVKFAKCELKHNYMPQAEWFCADGERRCSGND